MRLVAGEVHCLKLHTISPLLPSQTVDILVEILKCCEVLKATSLAKKQTFTSVLCHAVSFTLNQLNCKESTLLIFGNFPRICSP